MAQSEVELLPISCGVREDCTAGELCIEIPTEVHPDVNGCVQILFVGHVAGKGEQLRRRPFAGRIGTRLRTLILVARKLSGVDFGIAFSYLSRNCVVKGVNLTEDEFYYCMPHLMVDIDVLLRRGLKYIMPLGAVALDNMLGKIRPTSSTGMKKYIGNPIVVNGYPFNRVTVIPMVHPGRIAWGAFKFNIKKMTDYEKMFIKCLVNLFRDKDKEAGHEEKILNTDPVGGSDCGINDDLGKDSAPETAQEPEVEGPAVP